MAGLAVALFHSLGAPANASEPYSYAGTDDLGRRLTVCAESLPVYDLIGLLEWGETFTVKGFDGPHKQWVYGFAYGGSGENGVNAHGWVRNGWFCDA